MPSWEKLFAQIKMLPSQFDILRRNSLEKLATYRGRNVISYYSAFLEKPQVNSTIGDSDIEGLMNVVHTCDRSKGLDLILHTPGGGISATEAIVSYLRKSFHNDIDCFVPQIAMSAGTMIACACRKIYMGNQSSIGPIDPQFGGIPAHGVIEEFKKAVSEVKKDPAKLPLYRVLVEKYHPTFLGECEKAIQLSSDLVGEWLATGMFSGDPAAREKSKVVLKRLNNHKDTKQHDRHISAEKAKSFGLDVRMLEDDNQLQDLVLTLHHANVITMSQTSAAKIIENNFNSAFIQSERSR